MKHCARCGIGKPFSEFTPDKSKASGYSVYCKPCQAERSREYYARTKGAAARARYRANRTKRKAQSKAWRQANPDAARRLAREAARRRARDPEKIRSERRASYMKRHGGAEEWARMWEAQNGLCYLCLQPLPEDGTDVHVDHDHSCCPSTKDRTRSCRYCRRGLTHQACNQIWGLAKEDPQMLRTMADEGEKMHAEIQQRLADKPAQAQLI